jgi:putative oxidoreductase
MNKFLSPAPQYPDLGLTVVRVVTGLLMIYHGWEVFDASKMQGYTEWEMFKNASGKRAPNS